MDINDIPINGSLLKRFWGKVQQGPNGCWNWTASFTPNGYGKIGTTRRHGVQSVHRISWIIHFGRIPKGKCVLHKCDNRLCVNPDHLFLGSHHDNTHDMMQKGRHKPMKNIFITYNGITKPRIQWARELGVAYSTFRWRLAHWSIHKVLGTILPA